MSVQRAARRFFRLLEARQSTADLPQYCPSSKEREERDLEVLEELEEIL